MDPTGATIPGSTLSGAELKSLQFREEIHQLMTVPPENASSFTALLKLLPTQAIKLIHLSPDISSVPSNSGAELKKVKTELAKTDSNPNSSQLMLNETRTNQRNLAKRNEREKKVKAPTKKCKTEIKEDAEKMSYVHVRARRDQATDNHSLAERAMREKINARIKLLQELVPRCNKML
ncbi:hypothetical protein C1H46_039820 [Malus baccata]|uniref:BHLH domain-containing protein n=1 Tax=Malus baccata TaxID=106549 RepID=A0A540KKA0_MALBA|nr:hypothetical protein C1H46_039820 [Malus baccata]